MAGDSLARIERAHSEVHLYRMNLMFPGAVARCELEFAPNERNHYVIVCFKNGYKLRWREDDIGSDEFKASAIMLYDLPHKEV